MSPNLPKLIAPTPGIALRQGAVTAVGAGSCTVQIAGNDAVVGIKHMNHVGPVIGDIVWLLQNGTDMMVVGKMGTTAELTLPTATFTDNLYVTDDIYANRFYSSPADDGDDKFIIKTGSAYIGYRVNDDLYFYSGGGNFSFEAPGGSWAMRYGPLEVNADTERGLKVLGNFESGEIYSNSWFRQLGSGRGYYHHAAGVGWYANTDLWFRMYADANFNTAGWVQGGAVACNGVLRVRAYTDTCHQVAYIGGSIGSPSNGTQNIDGPMMSGYNATGLGSAPCRFNNIQLRAWDNGGDYRCDHYSPTFCLQGLWVTGTKSFLIDHPILGPSHHLQYAAIEGPSVDLIFRGRIKLTAGKATINLDDEVGQEEGTFEALTFEEDRQFFLYNETGGANPHGAWGAGAGDLNITCTDKTATIGWMIIAVRKLGHTEHGMTPDGRLMIEWEKNDIEASTTQVQPYDEQVDQVVAELEAWKTALPGSELNIDIVIAEHKGARDRHIEGRKEFKINMKKRHDFWANQKTKANARKEAKGRI